MSREAEIIVRASDREFDRSMDRVGSTMRKRFARLGRDFAGSIAGAARTGLDLVGVGGIGGIVAAGRQVYNFQTGLTRLQISSGKTKTEIQELERKLFAVGKAKGVDPEELLAGASAYTAATGDLQTYVDGLDKLGETATATGSDVATLSNVAQALTKNLGVAGSEWGQAFDIIAAQGKAGAVELGELARELPGLTPQFATFGTTGVAGVRQLGAALQIARSGFGSTAETATGLRAVMTNLLQNRAKFAAAKIKIFEDDGKTVRNFADIIYDIGESKVFSGKGGAGKLIDALGSSEAYRAILPLLSAGRAEFERLASISADGTIGKDFATFMDSPAGKMQSASAAIKEAFNNSLKGNIEGIARAMQKVADLIAWVGNHPYLAAALYAGARGGSALVASLLGGGGAGGGGGGGVAGLAGNLAGAGGAGGGRGAAMLGKAGAVGSAFAVGWSIGTAINAAVGDNLHESIMRATGKWDAEFEAKMARARALEGKISGRRAQLQQQADAGLISPLAATPQMAGLLGASDLRADEINSVRDTIRKAREAREKNASRDRNRKGLRNYSILEAIPESVLAQQQAHADALALKAKRAPALAADFLAQAQATDPRLRGLTAEDPRVAGLVSGSAIKTLSGRDPDVIFGEMLAELRKLSGAAPGGAAITIDLRIGDDGRLYAEQLDNGPQHRRH